MTRFTFLNINRNILTTLTLGPLTHSLTHIHTDTQTHAHINSHTHTLTHTHYSQTHTQTYPCEVEECTRQFNSRQCTTQRSPQNLVVIRDNRPHSGFSGQSSQQSGQRPRVALGDFVAPGRSYGRYDGEGERSRLTGWSAAGVNRQQEVVGRSRYWGRRDVDVPLPGGG